MRIAEAVAYTDLGTYDHLLTEGERWDALKGQIARWAKIGRIAMGLIGSPLLAQPAESATFDHCIVDHQQQRYECIMKDGRGVWVSMYDQNGRPVPPQVAEERMLQLYSKLQRQYYNPHEVYPNHPRHRVQDNTLDRYVRAAISAAIYGAVRK